MLIKTNNGPVEVQAIGNIRLKQMEGCNWRMRLFPPFSQHMEGWTEQEVDNVAPDEITRIFEVAPHLFAPMEELPAQLQLQLKGASHD